MWFLFAFCFSVFSDLNNPDKLAVAKELLKVLEGTSCKVCFDSKYAKPLEGCDCALLPYDEMYKACDIAVAVGGDGTTVKTAKNAAVNGKPYADKVEADDLNDFSSQLFSWFITKEPALTETLKTGRKLDDDTRAALHAALTAFAEAL